MKNLPCNACPHTKKGGDHCCMYGASLTVQEAAGVLENWGPDKLRYDRTEEGYRTAIDEKGCLFLDENGRCKIYGKPYHPAICRQFPVDAGDITICPELR